MHLDRRRNFRYRSTTTLAVRVIQDQTVVENDLRAALMKLIRAKDGWPSATWDKVPKYTPLDWWRLKSSDFAILREIATRVFSIPTSSAASERSWSTHAFTLLLTFQHENVGVKLAKGQVHYKDDPSADAGDSLSDSSLDLNLSDTETPQATSQGPTGALKRNIRNNSVARRSLFTRVRHSHLASPALPKPSTRPGQISRLLPLTQTTKIGGVFTRSDEYQLQFSNDQSHNTSEAMPGFSTPVCTNGADATRSIGSRSLRHS
ncbi:unnamed protein product [Phytophthora fragariaefolia]|uniref:Unnamed protein product n=1 Tax=Phytophthora fragariaefolia TaxID=1490495 RepID=A0A9W6X4N9_9STRA|nr:unnamed protein product [Phytophthora fragariaefolia]